MKFIVVFILSVLSVAAQAAGPQNFEQAKVLAKQYVYADQNQKGDLYCQCPWRWTGQSGGVMDLASCGYKVRAQVNRAQRLEWEHVVPASTFGRQRQCWQNGGRENCNQTDPIFNIMEADIHNLYPSVGEVNGDRSNFNISMAPNVAAGQYGQCPMKVDFQGRVAEPPAHSKGMIARIHFYMYDRYGLRMSQQQERILMAWDRAFPITAWEVERDRRNARVMGHGNPYVSRQKVWTQGYVSKGIYDPSAPSRLNQPVAVPQRPVPTVPQVRPAPVSPPQVQGGPHPAPIFANSNSKIYHVYGCPNYFDVSPQNRVQFDSEQQAQASGYRKAKNCP